MSTLQIHKALYLASLPGKGRCVFTRDRLAAHTIIEESPVIVMSRDERVHLDKTLLHDYIFEWGTNKEACCMALGYIAMYNHSYASNCEYFMDFEEGTIQVKTIRLVESGEELTINYNGDWDNKKPVWFETT